MTEIVFDHEDFDFETLEEELRADQQCQKLLQQFYFWLQQGGMTPEQASEQAYSADYYLRDYVLDFLQRAGHRATVVILDHDVLGLGHVWNARIHIGVHVRELRVEHVGIHRQQREMIVCPGHQGFGALLACVRLLGGRKRLDSRQRMVGCRNGLVNGRPVLLVGVVARFRTGVLFEVLIACL